MSEACLRILNKPTVGMPDVVDLFSGCGGLALGFDSAEFNIVAGMDIEPAAVGTASYNLHWRKGHEGRHICGDIRESNPNIFITEIGSNGCIVIGGPPCQAYSQIGKGKLRSLGQNRANTNDSRGLLYEDFIRHAASLSARAVIMENVPESVNYGGLNVPQHACELLENLGYHSVWTILNAADFGVPQIRERVFVIAVRQDENKLPVLPVPTHRSWLDKQTPCQTRFAKFAEFKNFKMPNEPDASCKRWVSVGEALSDLPELFPDHRGKYHLLAPNVKLFYKTSPTNEYQHLLRNWYGIPQVQSSGHCFRRTVRDFQIFSKMSPGDDFRRAAEIAEEILESECRIERVDKVSDPDRYLELRKKFVPPYSRDKFHEKWKKLMPNRPAHTLVAHLSVDTYSHIHPWEPRGISVREAARLQSFPDGFVFQCAMGDAFRQIGNAVPPLLSLAIANAVKSIFVDINA